MCMCKGIWMKGYMYAYVLALVYLGMPAGKRLDAKIGSSTWCPWVGNYMNNEGRDENKICLQGTQVPPTHNA